MSGLDCPHCGKSIELFKAGGGERIAKEMDVPFLGRIPIDPRIVSLGDDGKSILDVHPDADASKAIQGVVEKVLERSTAQLRDS
jgi:ATP-binding protein involved in chromosome partitioning